MDNTSDSNEDHEDNSWSCWLRTIIAGAGAMILVVFIRLNEAQPAVMLPQLKKANTSIHITADEETWIASLGFIMSPISATTTGTFFDAFGRIKKGLQVFYLTQSLGYAVMAFAQEVYQIYIGRVLCGTGIEICTKKHREVVFSILSTFYASGLTIMCIIGGYLSWNRASLVFSISAFVLFTKVCFIPESPAWLFKMGREDASIRSLQKLGRSTAEIQQELENFKLQCKDSSEKIEWRAVLEVTVWKPFVIMVTFFFLQSASGIYDFLSYSLDFVERLGTKYDPLKITLILSTTRLLASFTIVIFFQYRIGRKFALAFFSFWMTVSFAGLGAYEYVHQDVPVAERPLQWFPVASLLLYVTGSVLGMLGLPTLMSGEVFPLRVRGTITGATTIAGLCFVFFSVKMYNMYIDTFKMYGLLFTFAGFSFISVFFAIYVLPETKGKSLLEIGQGFLPKEKRQAETGAPQNISVHRQRDTRNLAVYPFLHAPTLLILLKDFINSFKDDTNFQPIKGQRFSESQFLLKRPVAG